VDVATIARMLQQGWLTTVPLALCSVLVLAVMIERFLRYRGIEKSTRDLTRSVVEALGKRDQATANAMCQTSKTPIALIFREGLAWKNIALAFYNYLNVKIGLINNSFARACERLVQALLYVESSAQPNTPVRAQETGHGHPLPA